VKTLTKNQLMEMLLEANERLRSAYSVAERKGKDTNWEAYQNNLKQILDSQHLILKPIREKNYKKLLSTLKSE
jgi:hypothetical protein